MNKILLSLGLSALIFSSTPIEAKKSSKTRNVETKEIVTKENSSTLTAIKQVITDFPELTTISNLLKDLVSHLKEALLNQTHCSITAVLTYDASGIQALKESKILETCTQFGEVLTTTINEKNQLVVTLTLDPENDNNSNDSDDDDFDYLITELNQDDDADTEKSNMKQDLTMLTASIELFSFQIEEAIAAVGKANNLDNALAEKLIPLFSIFNVFPMVEQFLTLILNQEQLQAVGNCQDIEFSFSDEKGTVIPTVSGDINKLVENAWSINKKIADNQALISTIQEAMNELTTVINKNQVKKAS